MPSVAGQIEGLEVASAPAPPELSERDRQLLLAIAQEALAVAAGASPATNLTAALRRSNHERVAELHAAVFVTLFEDHELRGCMGSLDESRPLPEAVADAAQMVANRDPRFRPVRPAELASIDVEISVLGPFGDVDAPESILLGVDGVVVERRGLSALLLPQVAPEHGWNAAQLWCAVCAKAGLPDDAWRDPATNLGAFGTTRFGGPACEPEGSGSTDAASPLTR